MPDCTASRYREQACHENPTGKQFPPSVHPRRSLPRSRDLIRSHMNPVHMRKSYFFLFPMTYYPHLRPGLLVCLFPIKYRLTHLSDAYYMPRPSQSPTSDHRGNVLMQLFPTPCHFIPVEAKHCPQHPSVFETKFHTHSQPRV